MKLTDLERKQLETNRALLGNALAEQAYMKVIMQGLKKLFDQAGRADVIDYNLDHPYEFEMATCDSLMKLYDLNYQNAHILLDEYERVLNDGGKDLEVVGVDENKVAEENGE